jgi:hypothetical protein
MSEGVSSGVYDPHELAESLRRLRERFGEFRGRL